MSEPRLAAIYRDYIACLNRRDWDALGQWVAEGVVHNGRRLGLGGYRAMLEQDVSQIPDLRFDVRQLVVDRHHVAARLEFGCTPKGAFMGLLVNGRRIAFHEHVFYEFRDDRIREVWSVIDKAAIEAQL